MQHHNIMHHVINTIECLKTRIQHADIYHKLLHQASLKKSDEANLRVCVSIKAEDERTCSWKELTNKKGSITFDL